VETKPLPCGEETVFMRPELVEHNFDMILKEEQINCQGADCLVIHEFNMTDAPMASDSSLCPIVDFKFMYVDEKGVLTHDSNQEVKIEKDSTGKVARIEI